MIGWGGIRFILELHFAILVGEEKHLARCVDTAAVQPVRLEDLFRVEEAKAAAAPVQCLVSREVGNESVEVSYPGVVVIPVEQVDYPLKLLLCCVEWVATLPLVVEERGDVEPNSQLIFDGGDVGDLDGVLDLIQLIGVE